MKKNLLWFGDIGRRNSFSRISEEVLPFLKEYYELYLLAPPKIQLLDTNPLEQGNLEYKITHIGDPMGTFDWGDFRRMTMGDPGSSDIHQLQMKYALMQLGYICDTQSINYLVILGGNFVCEWFMRLIRQSTHAFKNVKIIVWTPFDYIPTKPCLENLLKTDLLLVTNPILMSEIKKISPNSKLDWIWHGVSPSFKSLNRNKVLKELNALKPWNGRTKKLEKDDIIILNANNFIPRKRFVSTFRAFEILKKDKNYKNVRLWLHTDTDNPNFNGYFMTLIKDYVKSGDIIISKNNITDYVLNLIYNACQIGIQTSSGEGWSLTNCEHEITGAIQVVPDFLATKFNFQETGILIPTVVYKDKDDGNNLIKKNLVQITEVASKLKHTIINLKTLYPVKSNKNEYTWKGAAEKLKNIMTPVNQQDVEASD